MSAAQRWRCKVQAASQGHDGLARAQSPGSRALPQVPLGYQGPLLARPVNASCVQIPNELPGVFSVAAVGVQRLRSYYSNFSKRFIQVLPSSVAAKVFARARLCITNPCRLQHSAASSRSLHLDSRHQTEPRLAGRLNMVLSVA